MTAPNWDQLRDGGYLVAEREGLALATYPCQGHCVAIACSTSARGKMNFLVLNLAEVPQLVERLQAALQHAQASQRRAQEADAAEQAFQVIERVKAAAS